MYETRYMDWNKRLLDKLDWSVQGQSKKKLNLFNLNLLLYLQLNQICLLQITPLYC